MKCSGENVILRGKFHVVSCFPLHFMLYRGNLYCFSNSDLYCSWKGVMLMVVVYTDVGLLGMWWFDGWAGGRHRGGLSHLWTQARSSSAFYVYMLAGTNIYLSKLA